MKLIAFLLASATALLSVNTGCISDAPEETEEDPWGLKSDDPKKLIKLPFYFATPRTTVSVEIDRSKYSYPTVWQTSDEIKEAGLRIIAIKQPGAVNATPAVKKAAKEDMSKQLAAAGVLQDGDVALSFRPKLEATMAYPHIQMGMTHASLVYIKNGVAYNVDSPLSGNEYVGRFNTQHFIGNGTDADRGTDALQIFRPRKLAGEAGKARRAQLSKWAQAVAANRAYGKVKFQGDYMKPIFAVVGMSTGRNPTDPEVVKQLTRETVTKLGKIILQAPTTPGNLDMYCSEFAWHMLALSNCTEQQIRDAGAEGAACVDPVFSPMELVAAGADAATGAEEIGLAQGPLITYLSGVYSTTRTITTADGQTRPETWVEQIFNRGENADDNGRLSSGHRAVAEFTEFVDVAGDVTPEDPSDNETSLMSELRSYYTARGAGEPVEATTATAANANGRTKVGNYSPTAFFVDSMRDDAVRNIDYVATILFVGTADYEKAKTIRMPAGSSIPQ